MDLPEMERLLGNVDQRTQRIEQILPTLATTEAVHAIVQAAVAPLATKTELQAAVDLLATKAELQAAIEPLATKAELRAAIEPLATKAELRAAIAPLPTREEMHTAIAAAIEPLATKAEMREEGERTRRHFDVVAENLRDDIRIIAEGQVVLQHEFADLRVDVKEQISSLDVRVTRLETSRRRGRR